MKTLLRISLLAAAAAALLFPADTDQPAAVLSPLGIWRLCQVEPISLCGAVPATHGDEPDVLLLQGARAGTGAFAYTLTGTDDHGQQRVFTGVFLRNERRGSLTSSAIVASSTELGAGNLQDARITVQELAPNGEPWSVQVIGTGGIGRP
jgi:hypothetical protein